MTFLAFCAMMVPETERRRVVKKYIPYEKLSKREKRKLDLTRRTTWGNVNPVTRKPQNSKAYNRRTAQSWKRDLSSVPFDFSSVALFFTPCYNLSISIHEIWRVGYAYRML